MKRIVLLLIFLLGVFLIPPVLADFDREGAVDENKHPILDLVGENLTYDISFLWFDHLAEGTLNLLQGDQPGTYLIVLKARTLGVAAFLTKHRVEKFQTLMEVGPQGYLRPLWHSSHSVRGSKDEQREKISRYTFDYEAGTVRYQKSKNNRVYSDKWFDIEEDRPMFDILSAMYNLRLGLFGVPDDKRIAIPTFHRKGPQDIIVEPLSLSKSQDKDFFGNDPFLCRILVDPTIFGTKGRDILASFDADMRPHKGIIKNVIGIGDVRGVIRPD